MSRARERAVESSWFAPLLGAGIGAVVAKALQSRAQERSWDRERHGYRGDWDRERHGYRGDLEGPGYGYPRGYSGYEEHAGVPEERLSGEPGPGMGEKISGVGGVGEKVSDVKERARAKAEEMKERVQGAASSMRERLPDRERIRSSTREDTGLWALGALALGALFGFALPASEREREMLEPARRKARELGQQALEKGTEAMEKATEKVRSAGEQQPAGQSGATAGAPPAPGSLTPIH